MTTSSPARQTLTSSLTNIEIKFNKDTKVFWYVIDQVNFDKGFYLSNKFTHPFFKYPYYPVLKHNEVIPAEFTGIKVEHTAESVWYGIFENGKKTQEFLFSKAVVYNEDNINTVMQQSITQKLTKLAQEKMLNDLTARHTPEYYEDLELSILEDDFYTLEEINIALDDIEKHIKELSKTVGNPKKFVEHVGKDPEHYVLFQAMRSFLEALNTTEKKFLDINDNLHVVELLHELESLYWCQVVPKTLEKDKKFVSILETKGSKLVEVLMDYDKETRREDVQAVSEILDELNNYYYGTSKIFSDEEERFLLWILDTINSWVDYSRIKLLDSEYEFGLLSIYTDHINRVINDQHKAEKEKNLTSQISEFIYEDLGFLTYLEDNVTWLSKEHRNIVSKMLDKYSSYILRSKKEYDFSFVEKLYKNMIDLGEELKPESKMVSSTNRFYALGELTELIKIEAGGYLDGILSFSKYVDLVEVENELKGIFSRNVNFEWLLDIPKTYKDYKYYALATKQMLHEDHAMWKQFATNLVVRMHTFIETEELSVIEYNNLFNLSCLLLQTIGLDEIDSKLFVNMKAADVSWVRKHNFKKTYSRSRNVNNSTNALVPENADVYEMASKRKKSETLPPPPMTPKKTFVDYLKDEPYYEDDEDEDNELYYEDDDLVDVDVYALPSIAEQVTEVLKDETTEVAYRLAAKQLQSLVKNFLADQLSLKQKNGKRLSRDVALSFLSTDLGSTMVLATVTTLLEKHIPKKHLAGLSKELRVATLVTSGNLLVDSLKTVLDKAPELLVPAVGSVPLEEVILESPKDKTQEQQQLVVNESNNNSNNQLQQK